MMLGKLKQMIEGVEAERPHNTYECYDSSIEFESDEVKEKARCPECGGPPRPSEEGSGHRHRSRLFSDRPSGG